MTIDIRYTKTNPGKISEILVKEQETVAVGQIIAKIDEGAGETAKEKVEQVEETIPVTKEEIPRPQAPPEPKKEPEPVLLLLLYLINNLNNRRNQL